MFIGTQPAGSHPLSAAVLVSYRSPVTTMVVPKAGASWRNVGAVVGTAGRGVTSAGAGVGGGSSSTATKIRTCFDLRCHAYRGDGIRYPRCHVGGLGGFRFGWNFIKSLV